MKEKGVKGVFFLTGHYVESQPELVQRMIDEGHVLGNHSWDHPESINELPLEEVESSIMTLHEYVKENFDYTMRLWRCPAGVFTEQQLALAQQLGYRSVFWSFAYRDWLVDDQPDPAEALDTMLTKAHPGAIYLIHAVSQTNSELWGPGICHRRSQRPDPIVPFLPFFVLFLVPTCDQCQKNARLVQKKPGIFGSFHSFHKVFHQVGRARARCHPRKGAQVRGR